MEGKNVLVTLSEEEGRSAALLGVDRRLKSKLAGLRDTAGRKPGGAWDMDIEGAMAEMVYAKALGIYYLPGIDTFKAPDVDGVQVRSTQHKAGSLIVRPNDADDEVFVLIINAFPRFRIVGWMSGEEAKQKQYLDGKNTGRTPAYFVPQHKLHPFPVQ